MSVFIKEEWNTQNWVICFGYFLHTHAKQGSLAGKATRTRTENSHLFACDIDFGAGEMKRSSMISKSILRGIPGHADTTHT